MAKTARKAAEAERSGTVWAGLQFGAVVGVLLLGAILRSDQPARQGQPGGGPGAHGFPGLEPSAAHPAAAGDPLPRTPADTNWLAHRVQRDVMRLAATGDGWTAQLGVFCEADRAETLGRRFAGDSPLYVLPTHVDDAPCFLVCWNRYDDADAARDAADLPGELRRLQPSPLPRRVHEALE